MWDRRKPNKPATGIGEEGVLAILSAPNLISRTTVESQPPGNISDPLGVSGPLHSFICVLWPLNAVSASVVESPGCPVTALAWHPNHRSTVALGKACACRVSSSPTGWSFSVFLTVVDLRWWDRQGECKGLGGNRTGAVWEGPQPQSEQPGLFHTRVGTNPDTLSPALAPHRHFICAFVRSSAPLLASISDDCSLAVLNAELHPVWVSTR